MSIGDQFISIPGGVVDGQAPFWLVGVGACLSGCQCRGRGAVLSLGGGVQVNHDDVGGWCVT